MLGESAIGILTFPSRRIDRGVERETMTREAKWRVMRVLADNHHEEAESS